MASSPTKRFVFSKPSNAARQSSQSNPLEPYYSDPVAFAHDCIDWREDNLAGFQEELLAALVDHLRVCARGPRGVGKTTLESISVLWFAITREAAGIDWKIPTTAGSWSQLSVFLWPEIHKWSRRLRWDKIGREPFDPRHELLDLHLKLEHGEAFAVASKNTDLIEGAHASELLYIFDEAQAIPDTTWDGAEGSLSKPGRRALAISRPGVPLGRFYDIHSRKPGYEDWWTRHVTQDEAIAAGRMYAPWAKQREKQWGKKSALFQNHVLGEFAAQDESSVIPLAWVEVAVDRWHRWKAEGAKLGPLSAVSLDPADGGGDRAILVKRHGAIVPELQDVTQPDPFETMALAGMVTAACHNRPGVVAIIDSIGIGSGIVSRCRENGTTVIAFNAGSGTTRTDEAGTQFLNKRAALYWGLRERLDPDSGDEIVLPPDDELIGDLTSPTWKTTSSGKIQLESKDDIRARLGRSTDKGDAVAQVFWTGSDEPQRSEPQSYAPTVSAEYGKAIEQSGALGGRNGTHEPAAASGWRTIHD